MSFKFTLRISQFLVGEWYQNEKNFLAPFLLLASALFLSLSFPSATWERGIGVSARLGSSLVPKLYLGTPWLRSCAQPARRAALLYFHVAYGFPSLYETVISSIVVRSKFVQIDDDPSWKTIFRSQCLAVALG